jgi:hypothetical protein
MMELKVYYVYVTLPYNKKCKPFTIVFRELNGKIRFNPKL